jgi:hypothetical protein
LQQVAYGGITKYTVPDFDLLNEGRQLLSKLKETLTISLSWVKGHFTGGNKSIEHKLMLLMTLLTIFCAMIKTSLILGGK